MFPARTVGRRASTEIGAQGAGADGGTRTRTGIPKRILSPLRLPFRHVRKREAETHVAEGTGFSNQRAPAMVQSAFSLARISLPGLK